jgi:hypothetical protein
LTLKEREKAIMQFAPGQSGTSHDKKSWQRARREYLAKFGYGLEKAGLTPLEQFLKGGEKAVN